MKDPFQQSFDLDRFNSFITLLFNHATMLSPDESMEIEKAFVEYIDSYKKMADYINDQGKHLLIAYVAVKKGCSRNIQRNFVTRYINKNNYYKAAIIAIYNTEL